MRAVGRGNGGRAARLAATLAAIAVLGGCGGGGSGSSSVAQEKESDAAIINVAIGRELTLVDTFDAGAQLLHRPYPRALIRQLRGQELEHLNGLTKTLRGLGASVEAEPGQLDLGEVKTERDLLLHVYDLTSSTLTGYLEAIPHLDTRAPRAIAASIGASEAQHLVQLRQALGSGALEAAPEAFDTGEVPPPGELPPAEAGPAGEKSSPGRG